MSKQKNTEPRFLHVGVKYKHFKGTVYTVRSIVRHSETDEILVVYSSESDEMAWARPLEMFFDTIEREDYQGPRFRLLREEIAVL